MKTLRVLLAEKKIKQKTLAEAVGVSPGYICLILNPRVPPLNIKKKKEIAKFLGVSIAEIDWQGI